MKKLIHLIFFLILSVCSFSQENNFVSSELEKIRFDHISIEDGLANSTVRQIIQDEQGFVWFVALNALCRFDGAEFKTYKHNPKNNNSLTGDRINAFVEYEKGIFIVGSWQSGISVLNTKTDSVNHYRFNISNKNSIGSDQVNSIYIDNSKQIWIGAGNSLNLFNLTNKSFTKYELNQNGLIINSIIETENDGLYLITNELKLFKFDTIAKTFIQLNIIPEKDQNPLIWRCRLKTDSKGNLWICTVKNGLYRYDFKTKKLENFRYNPNNPYSISFNEVYDIIEDENDTYWIATDGGGLNYFKYKTKKFYPLKHDPNNRTSLANNQPFCIYKDNSNIIWIGLYNGGVNIYDKNKEKFHSYSHNPNDKNSLSNSVIWSFEEDENGDILIGTDRGGLNIYNPGKYGNRFIRIMHNENNPNSIPSNTIISLLIDSKNRIWLGTYNDGLIEYNRKNNTFNCIKAHREIPENSSYPIGNDVWDLDEDIDGNLWIATLRYGVDVYNTNTKKFKHYNRENSNLSNNRVTTILADSKNRIWIGSAEGLNLYNKETDDFKIYKTNEDANCCLPGDNIRLIYEDKQGFLWIGTEGSGLSKMNIEEESFVNYSEQDGLPSNVIYGMLEDDIGNLWISTSRGLSKFNIYTEKFKNYTKKEGLQSNEFKQGAYFKTNDGKLLFGGINGFNMFKPDNIKDNTTIPPVIITGFYIFNEAITPDTKNSPLTKDISYTKSIKLSYKQSVFSFKYTALNYTIPEKNEYAYIMEGFDEQWHMVGNKREAVYTNLDAGKYIFKVKASNNDGVWNEAGASINLTILPPWWQTLIFKFTMALLIIIIALSFYYNRINQIKKQKEELEKQVKIRTYELTEANEELKSKQEEILTQNEEIQQQNEEIIAQRDEIQEKNEKLEATNNKIKTLNNFGQELTTVLNLKEINKMIYGYVGSLIDTSVFGIGVYNEDTRSIEFTSLLEDGIPVPEFSSPLNDSTSCAAWCYKKQQTIFSNSFKDEYSNFITELKIRSSKTPESLIYVPLNVKNKNIGILTVQSYHENAYTENDLLTLQTLASYIAIALDNAFAYDLIKTQFNELELHRSKLEQLVKNRTKDLEAAKIKAEESDKLKSAFLANMSHEIRTPLNAIVGFAELLVSEDYEQESKDEIIQVIERNTYSLLNLINDIIDISKIEAGEIKIIYADADVNELLNEIYQTFSKELVKLNKEVKLVLNLQPQSKNLIVYTDLIRLKQILTNLIDNAIKYTEKGEIEFGIKNIKEEEITFYVKDTGIGIDKNDFEVIFDRFRKIEGDKALYRGTGLGLSITKHLVERLGGKIWLESEINKGSEFIFILPIRKNKEKDKIIKRKEKPYAPDIPDWSKKTVLIVEDEDSNYKVIETMLKSTKIKIIRAVDGLEAIDLYKENVKDINIILMDIKLPRMDGISATSIIKEINKNVPVIAQTAYALSEEEHKIRKAGFEEYMAKPINREKLLQVMKEFIS